MTVISLHSSAGVYYCSLNSGRMTFAKKNITGMRIIMQGVCVITLVDVTNT